MSGHFKWEPKMTRLVSPHLSLEVKWPSTLDLCTRRLFTTCLTISIQLKWPDTCVSSFGVFGHFVTPVPHTKSGLWGTAIAGGR